MKDQQTFLREVVSLLGESGVAYMISGSIASSFYGEPRATRDIDIVIDCDSRALGKLIRAVEHRGWYISEHAAREALHERSMFNVIEPDSGWKADFIVRKDRPYSKREFERRSPQYLFADEQTSAITVTAEDAILSKLEWFKTSGSEQQFHDAVSIAQVEGSRLDLAYLNEWAESLGVTPVLQQLRKVAHL